MNFGTYHDLTRVRQFSFTKDLKYLKQSKESTSSRSANMSISSDAHWGLSDTFVLYNKQSLLHPQKITIADKGLFLLQGNCDVVIFSTKGVVDNVVRLDGKSRENPFFCRIPPHKFYSLLIDNEDSLILESTWKKKDLPGDAGADWVSADNEIFDEDFVRTAAASFLIGMDEKLVQQRSGLKLIRESEKVFRIESNSPISHLYIEKLGEIISHEGLDRARICVHKDNDDLLQEMFMIFSETTFVTPSYHEDKDESLFVLDGLATCIFFDSSGQAILRIPLGPKGNSFERASYCWIPRNTIHTLVVESEYVILKETTSGPFSKDRTFFPDWAPETPARQDLTTIRKKYLGELN